MAARHRIPELSPEGRAAAEALRRDVAGEVSTTPLRRWLYSTDASGYRVVPEVVLVAGSAGRPGRRGGGLRRHRPAGRGARRRLQRGRAGDRPGHRRRLLQARPHPGDRRATAAGPGSSPASSRRRSTRPRRRTASSSVPTRPPSTRPRSPAWSATTRRARGRSSTARARTRCCASPACSPAARRPCSAAAPAATSRPASAGRRGRGSRRRSRRCASGTASPSPATTRGRGAAPPATTCASSSTPEPNLGRLLAGSEGTLALFTELEVLLDPRPARRVGAAFTFTTLHAALDANVAILETGPSAVEFLDLEPLRRAPNLAQYRSMAALLDGTDAALLTVEYQGSEEEALAGLARLRALAGALGAQQLVWLEEPEALAEAAALRRAVLPLLMGAPGAERPAAFVEDTAVAPERLADFVADLQTDRRGPRHPRQLHRPRVRRVSAPPADARPQDGVRRGAHGTARRRGRPSGRRLPRRVLGGARLRALAQLVPAAAPRPGPVRGDGRGQGRVRPPPAAQPRRRRRRPAGRRVAPLRRRLPRRPRLDAAPLLRRRGRLRARPSRSASAPACARSSPAPCARPAPRPGTRRAPRGRAPTRCRASCAAPCRWRRSAQSEFRDVLGTCVACKACKTECPAGVDMAALKVEWLAELRAREGVPAARARHRRLPPARRPGRAGGAAGERARPHPRRAGGDRPRRRGAARGRCRRSSGGR